jgi:hypothetical protein
MQEFLPYLFLGMEILLYRPTFYKQNRVRLVKYGMRVALPTLLQYTFQLNS